ncbi:MAG TPA: squalene/phytoene synthase family protein [Candidatus Acidoferrales bacterium]|nr:squalene/phytoene synthase family protein [Candidatus Acidoferrales bacterium]
MSDLDELTAADEYCQFLVRRHYENFVAVSGLVRGQQARDLARIYAYCRTTDDLGDEGPSGSRLERLQRWRDDVAALFAGSMPLHPVLVALRETVSRLRLPEAPFMDLIQANVQDQSVTAYESWPELRAYCMLSAAPVGRMVLPVFGIANAEAVALSDDVCVGLQLANHAQDVSRDGARGRCYLLQSELRVGGVVAATRGLCERARELLAAGVELETMAPYAYRVQLRLYRLGGLAIVAAIARQGFVTDVRRPHISNATKVLLLVRACCSSLFVLRHEKKLETA